MRNRVIVSSVIWIMILCCAFMVVTPQAWAKQERVRLYFKPYISNAPIMIADHEGYFEDEGIAIEFVKMRNTSDGIVALLQKKLDIVHGPLTGGLYNAAKAGKFIKIVVANSYIDKKNDGYRFVVSGEAGNGSDVEDLVRSFQGEKVAIPILGSLHHYFIEELLERYGLKAGDVELMAMPFSSISTAIETNALKAGFLLEPLATRLNKKRQVPYISYGDVFADVPVAYLMYGETLLQDNPALGVKFMKAYIRACAQYDEGKTEKNISILKKYMQLDESVLREMTWTTIRPEGVYQTEILDKYQEWLREKHFVQDVVDVGLMVDTSFLEKAKDH